MSAIMIDTLPKKTQQRVKRMRLTGKPVYVYGKNGDCELKVIPLDVGTCEYGVAETSMIDHGWRMVLG